MPIRQAVRDLELVDLDNVGAYAARRLSEVTAESARGLVRREFHLPYLTVTGHFSSESYADLCTAGLVTRAEPHDAQQRQVDIHVTSSNRHGSRPAQWRESSFSPGVFERVITGNQLRGYYHHDYRFWQFYDPALGRGIQSMRADDSFPPWEPASPLRAFLHWAYDELGMRLAHAATLGLGSRGVLLAGAGGSGKSGTTLAGLVHGLSSVGDDYVLVDRGPVRRAHAIFAKMKQDIDGLRRVGLNPFSLGGGRLNWQDKLEFSATNFRGDALADQLEIVAIVLPKIAHCERTSFRPARQSEAMLALAPSGLFQMPGCAASGVRFFSQLVRELPSYEMLLSEDPADIAGALHDFLSRQGVHHAG